MEKLIILSDLWGNLKSDWISNYASILENYFEITFYDCCELANINLSDYSEGKIHQQFINGGIDSAVNTLLKKEKENVYLLGFSVGGLIAWKAILKGLKAQSLTALSSTRLRYEVKRPECPINLIYAENDKYKPAEDWFIKSNLEMNIYKDMDHEFYRDKNVAIEVSKTIINQIKPTS